LRRIAWAGIVAGLALGLAADIPWQTWVGHSHWSNVGWIPFYSGPIRLTDICQNLFLFAPVGFAAALAFRNAPRLAAALVLVASLTGETTQVYAHGRFPSATDVTCNVAGAWIAAKVGERYLPWRKH